MQPSEGSLTSLVVNIVYQLRPYQRLLVRKPTDNFFLGPGLPQRWLVLRVSIHEKVQQKLHRFSWPNFQKSRSIISASFYLLRCTQRSAQFQWKENRLPPDGKWQVFRSTHGIGNMSVSIFLENSMWHNGINKWVLILR